MIHSIRSFFSRQFRFLCFGLAALALLATTGCATHYVDSGLKDVPPEKLKKAAAPKPVQLLFEFQTKGATNARATDGLKEKITEMVKNTGLFSQVDSAPANNGSVLSIVIDNVPLTDNPGGKGFVTGLTFGLAGTAVTDGYICTIEYLPEARASKISTTVRHAIHTTLGATSAPVNGVKSASIQEALDTMLRQIVTNGLNDVASNPSFK
jgi:hypothetical protein